LQTRRGERGKKELSNGTQRGNVTRRPTIKGRFENAAKTKGLSNLYGASDPVRGGKGKKILLTITPPKKRGRTGNPT